MTPTASRLSQRLEERRRWFSNEWFFKWHFIGKEGPVTIDGFDGRNIHYGGILFGGTARDVYWDAITRGVRKEITEQFVWIDHEIRNYNFETAIQSIDECVGHLISFARSVRHQAIEKDRILTGNGINFPPLDDSGNWRGTSEADIVQQAEAIKTALPVAIVGTETPTVARKWSWWERNKFWLEPVAWLVGIASAIVGLIVYFL